MKIVIAEELERKVVDEFRKISRVAYIPRSLEKELADADVLIVRNATNVTKKLLDKGKELKVVARAGVGLDNIDLKECERRGIKVINTPEASTISVAELTIGLMISLLRKSVRADSYARRKIHRRGELIGHEVHRKTLGVIGFGRIGKMVAEKAHALGMNVLVSSPHAKNTKFAKAVPLEELLSSSDVITIHVALTPETKRMINKKAIARMKYGVYLLNMARGEVVDEEALHAALRNGKIAGAALDVTAREPYKGKLLKLDNVIFSSHTGANTYEAQVRIGEELLKKIKEIFMR